MPRFFYTKTAHVFVPFPGALALPLQQNGVQSDVHLDFPAGLMVQAAAAWKHRSRNRLVAGESLMAEE